ncbi:PREDICTED: 5'-adenylylsulfate reductase-like 7 [Tarenaya hassleriana]|uniref:5'-adenylylsulfate reductase-like 7 n=1 Tax=Tarenaya hassleriana TaxID=28532 RepID=UPI00053C3150|nr:PREDICTED: 5'-adenylylsulfate reductase-like 7 [Tarenaya hassleriana]
MVREPYLAFAVMFLLLKLAMIIVPRVISRMKAIWASQIPQILKLGIIGETSRLFGRALHMIDLRMKLRLTKTSSFHERAKKARAWASSLASISPEKPSPTISSSQG